MLVLIYNHGIDDGACSSTWCRGPLGPTNRPTATATVPKQCPLCQQEADKWHSCWTCPNLLQIEDEDISNSNYLVDELQVSLRDSQPILETLWLRGLVTKAQITQSSDHNPLEAYTVTIRHSDYIPPAAGHLDIRPQLSLTPTPNNTCLNQQNINTQNLLAFTALLKQNSPNTLITSIR